MQKKGHSKSSSRLIDKLYNLTRIATPHGIATKNWFNIIFTCSAYIVASISLSVYNKWLIHTDFHGFSFPVLLICIHSLSNFLFSGFATVLCFQKSSRNSDHWITKINAVEYVKYLAPIGLFIALDVCLTHVSYMFISIALCEIVKSAVPIAVMVVGFYLGREDIDFVKAATMTVITFGVILTVLSEMDYDKRGFIAAFFAMIFAVAKLVWMETVLGGKKVPSLLAMFYFSPVSFLSLGIGFFPIEFNRVHNSPLLSESEIKQTIGYICIGCLIAFILNLLELLVIQNTSALTMCVTDVLRFVLLIPISVLTFGHHLNVVNVMGIFVTGLGIGLYQYTKYRDIMHDMWRFKRLQNKRRGSNLPSIPEEEEGAYSPSTTEDARSQSSPQLNIEMACESYAYGETEMGYRKIELLPPSGSHNEDSDMIESGYHARHSLETHR